MPQMPKLDEARGNRKIDPHPNQYKYEQSVPWITSNQPIIMTPDNTDTVVHDAIKQLASPSSLWSPLFIFLSIIDAFAHHMTILVILIIPIDIYYSRFHIFAL